MNTKTVRLTCGCTGYDAGLDGYVHASHPCPKAAEQAARDRAKARESMMRSVERHVQSTLNGNDGFRFLR